MKRILERVILAIPIGNSEGDTDTREGDTTTNEADTVISEEETDSSEGDGDTNERRQHFHFDNEY